MSGRALPRLLALAGIALAACGGEGAVEVAPVDIGAGEACALDGMLLAQHDGPKAQLLRKNGQRAFFCDAKEAFAEWLDPVRRQAIAGLWFQVLDEAPWEAHAGGWAAAAPLSFVVGSSKMGSMGPTLAPFVERAHADSFAARYGGRVFAFSRIDAALLDSVRRQGMRHWDE